MKEHEKEGRDNTHNPDNITLAEGTENVKVKKSVTFQDDKVAYISKGVKEKATKVSNKDKNDEEKGNNTRKTSREQVPDASVEAEGKDRKELGKDENKKKKGNNIRKTSGEQVLDASAEAEGKDRKEPDKDETKQEKGNITQETNDEQVEEQSAQFAANTEAGISDPMEYKTENIAELKVDIPEKEHGAGVPDVGIVKVNRGVVEQQGRHTINKKKISPKRIVQLKQDDKTVRSGEKDPEYIPPVEDLPSNTRRESKRIKHRVAAARKGHEEEDEDDIPLAHLRRKSDEKLSKKHNLKSCSIAVEKMRVATKAERKEMPTSGNWFEHLQTMYDKKSQLGCDFDDDEEEADIAADCNFCGHVSNTLAEHLEHIKIHAQFYCERCLSPFIDQEEYDNHMDEVHRMNVTDNTGGLAQNLIRGSDNLDIGVLVQVSDTINKELSQYHLAVVVEDSPPKKSPVKERFIEVKSEAGSDSDSKRATEPTLSNEEHEQALIREAILIQEYIEEYEKVPLDEIPLSEDAEKRDTCDSEADNFTSPTSWSFNESPGGSKIPKDKKCVASVTESQSEDGASNILSKEDGESTEPKLSLTDSQSGAGDEGTKDEATNDSQSNIWANEKEQVTEKTSSITQSQVEVRNKPERDEKNLEEGDNADSQSGEGDGGTKDEAPSDCESKNSAENKEQVTDATSCLTQSQVEVGNKPEKDEKKQEKGDNADSQSGEGDGGTKDEATSDCESKNSAENKEQVTDATSCLTQSQVEVGNKPEKDEKKQEKGDNADSQSGEGDGGTKDEATSDSESKNSAENKEQVTDATSCLTQSQVEVGNKPEKDEKKQEKGDNADSQSGEGDGGTKDEATSDCESKNSAENKEQVTDATSCLTQSQVEVGNKPEKDEKKQEKGDNADSQSGEGDGGTKDEATSDSESKNSAEKKEQVTDATSCLTQSQVEVGNKPEKDEKKLEEGDNADSQSGEGDWGTKDEATSDSESKNSAEKKEHIQNLHNIDGPSDDRGSVMESHVVENLTPISSEIEATSWEHTSAALSIKEDDSPKLISGSESDHYHDSSSYKESDHKQHENDKQKKHMKRKRPDVVGQDSDTNSPILRKRKRTRKLVCSDSATKTASEDGTLKTASNVATESGSCTTRDSGIECRDTNTRKRDPRLRKKKPCPPAVERAMQALKKARARFVKKTCS